MSNIITTAELGTYTGETLDAGRATQVVAAVNDYIENVTGRCWGATKTATESHDRASVLFLRHMDVVTVTSVETGQGSGSRTTLPPDSYFVNALGRLVLDPLPMGFSRVRDYVHVTYEYGVPNVPADLKQGALSLAADFYTYASDGNRETSAESIGSYRLDFKSGSASASGATLATSFDRYRVVRV